MFVIFALNTIYRLYVRLKERARQEQEQEHLRREAERLARAEQEALARRNTNDPLPESKPIFKILKRDPVAAAAMAEDEQLRRAKAAQSHQVKSEAERKAEYAAARARIMGPENVQVASAPTVRLIPTKKPEVPPSNVIRSPAGPVRYPILSCLLRSLHFHVLPDPSVENKQTWYNSIPKKEQYVKRPEERDNVRRR